MDILKTFKTSIADINPVDFVERAMCLRGTPMRIRGTGRDYLVPYYNYLAYEAPKPDSMPVITLKGRQVEMTTTAICIVLYYLCAGGYVGSPVFTHFNVLYTFPRKEQAEKFYSDDTKLAGFLKNSIKVKIGNTEISELEWLRDYTKKQSMAQTSFKYGNQLFIGGAWGDAAALRGITSDCVVFDEIQDLSLRALHNTRESYTVSRYKVELGFGTPLLMNSEFDRMWQKSNQQFFHFRCPKCEKLYILHPDNWTRIWKTGFMVECPHCFPASTDIIMSNFSKKEIKDIEVGDEVITHLNESKKVTKTFCRPYDGKLVSIRSKGSNILINSTLEHPYYVIPKKDTLCKKRGSQLVCKRNSKSYCRNCTYIPIPIWKKAQDLVVGDHLLKKIPIIETYPIHSIEYLRLLGYFAAEGHYLFNIYKDKKFFAGIGFSIHKNEYQTIGREIVSLCNELSSKNTAKVHFKNNVCSIFLYDKNLAEKFFQDIGKGARCKQLSEKVLRDSNILEFIGTFIEGDGYIGKSKKHHYIIISSTSKNLVSQMSNILLSKKILHSVTLSKNSIPKTSKQQELSIYRIEIPQLYISTVLPYVKFKGKDIHINFRKENCQIKILNGYICYEITKLEQYDFNGNVYNFEVENDHSYLVEDRIVHNCTFLHDKRKAVARGEWIAQRTSDFNRVGFHFSQYIHPAHTFEELVRKKEDLPPMTYKNEVEGEFYAGTTRPLTFAELVSSSADPYSNLYFERMILPPRETYMGVDWGGGSASDDGDDGGGGSFTAVVIVEPLRDGNYRIVHAHKFVETKPEDQVSQIAEWIRIFNVKDCVADAGYGHIEVAKLQNEWGDKVKACYYSDSRLKSPYQYNKEKQLITVDKHATLELVYEELASAKWQFPYRDPNRVDWLIEHCTNVEIETVVIGGMARKRFKKPHRRRNDGLMAINYARIAHYFRRSNGFVVQALNGPGSETRNFPKPRLARFTFGSNTRHLYNNFSSRM